MKKTKLLVLFLAILAAVTLTVIGVSAADAEPQAEEIKYGTIPAEYSDAEAWPFAIFDSEGNFLAASDRWCTNDTAGTNPKKWTTSSGALTYFTEGGNGNGTSGSGTYTILLRRDYTLKENGKSEATYDNVAAMKFNTMVIDLGGNTFSFGENPYSLINMALKRGGGLNRIFQFKNGTIDWTKAPAGSARVFSTRYDNKTDQAINLPEISCTFEGVIFNNVTDHIIYFDNTGTGGKEITVDHTVNFSFKDCTATRDANASAILLVNTNKATHEKFTVTTTFDHFIVDGVVATAESANCFAGSAKSTLVIDPTCSEFTAEVEDAKCAKVPATCQTPGVYYKSCPVCGAPGGTETFVGKTLDPDNHAVEGTGTCACGVVVTEYGVIPVEYTNATTYPFAVFVDGKFVTGLKRWTTNEDTYKDAEAERGLIHMIQSTQIIPRGKNVNVLMRRDYTCSTSTDGNFNNFSYAYFLSINLDLGGYKFTNTDLKLFNIFYKGTAYSSLSRVITVKNGTITNTQEHVVTISGARNDNTIPGCTITFENVSFKDAVRYVVIVASLASSPSSISNSFTFKNCTFERADTAKEALFGFNQLEAEGKTAELVLENCIVHGETDQADWLLEGTYGKATALDYKNHDIDTTVWVSDGNGKHGNPCKIEGCDFLDNLADCAGTATCMAKAHCSVCDTDRGEIDPNAHNFDTENWTTDGNGTHWHACLNEGCTVKDSVGNCDGVVTCVKAHCSVCDAYYGEVDPNAHNFDTENWTTDIENGTHWHACLNEGCEVKDSEGKCDGEATCVAKAHCSVCDAEYGEIDPDAHDFENEWTSDGTSHWHKCLNEGCQVKGDLEECYGGWNSCVDLAICWLCENEYGDYEEHEYTADCDQKCDYCMEITRTETSDHTYEDVCDVYCNECETARTAPHAYKNACDSSCDLCFKLRTPAEHVGGTATCKDAAVCTVCGASYGEKLAEHTYASAWVSGANTHWHECACGAKSGEAAHVFSNVTETDGKTVKSCECGYSYEVITPEPEEKGGVAPAILIIVSLGAIAVVGGGAAVITLLLGKKKA